MADKKPSLKPRQFPAFYEKSVPVIIGVLLAVIVIMLLFAIAVLTGFF